MKYKIMIMVTGLIVMGLLCPIENPMSLVFAGDVVFIVSKNVPENSLTRDDIKNIFLGRKTQWDNNQQVVFVTLEESEAHETFLKEYVGKTSFQYINYWRKQVFTGKGKPPKSFKTEEELIDYVANTDGAVGYISSEADNSKVKTISVR